MTHGEPDRDADFRQRVPEAMRTPEFCLDVLRNSSELKVRFAEHFPVGAFTPTLAMELARRHADNLRWIPPALLDKAVCMATPADHGGFALAHVPKTIVDLELCLHALRCGESLGNIPEVFRTKGMCQVAVERNTFALEHVPQDLRCDALYVVALAHGAACFVNPHLPNWCLEMRMLKQALAYRKEALHTIPGRLFEYELYAHAKSLYGSDADWAEILERHGQRCSPTDHEDCAEQCWRVFWKEPFAVEQLDSGAPGPGTL